MNLCWRWLSADDERDPREFREYVGLFQEGLAPSATTPEPAVLEIDHETTFVPEDLRKDPTKMLEALLAHHSESAAGRSTPRQAAPEPLVLEILRLTPTLG